MSRVFTAKEKLAILRYHRGVKLKETDHWAFQDTPDMTAEQIAYRQALRDLTKDYKTMEDVVWPKKPD